MRNALQPVSTVVWFVVRNLLALITFLLIGFGVDLLERRMLGWPVPTYPPTPNEPAALLACAIGMVIAWRLRARPTMFFVAGIAAWRVTMFLVRNVYGIQWARNEAQFAAMLAGIVGVVFGALLVRYARPSKDSSAVSTREPTRSPMRLILGKLLKPDAGSVQQPPRRVTA
jgi:hypothetical protein